MNVKICVQSCFDAITTAGNTIHAVRLKTIVRVIIIVPVELNTKLI